MRSALAAGIAFVLAVAGLGAGYGIGNATSHTETTTSTATVTVTSSDAWTVVVQNGTFTGPGCPSRPALANPLSSLHELHHVERLPSRVQRQGLLRCDTTGGIVELDHLHNLHRLVRQLDSVLRESLLVGERAPDLSATIRDSSGGGATLPCLTALSCSSDTLKSGLPVRPSGEKRWASSTRL